MFIQFFKNEKNYTKNSKKNNINYKEVKQLYNSLEKYRQFHPDFNLKIVMFKLYPNLNWNELTN